MYQERSGEVGGGSPKGRPCRARRGTRSTEAEVERLCRSAAGVMDAGFRRQREADQSERQIGELSPVEFRAGTQTRGPAHGSL
jgi:hypothetical protein